MGPSTRSTGNAPVAAAAAATPGRLEAGSPVARLRGELDVYDLDVLETFLRAVADLGRPVFVDLSGVTFLDLGWARRLAVSHLRSPDLLVLCNPSWQAVSSFAACGCGNRIEFRVGTTDS